MNTQYVLSLTLAFFFLSGAQAATITFSNNCSYTVWPGILATDQKPQLSTTGFELASGASNTVDVQSPWNGRFWARTGCSTTDSGKFTCATADCGSSQVECNGSAAVPPATLIELAVAAYGEWDFYDVSNVDGFNVPLSIAPRGGGNQCPDAFSYAYDDNSGTFTCSGAPNYVITFCPIQPPFLMCIFYSSR